MVTISYRGLFEPTNATNSHRMACSRMRQQECDDARCRLRVVPCQRRATPENIDSAPKRQKLFLADIVFHLGQ